MAASILRRLTKKQLCVFGLVLVTLGLFITFSTLTLFAKAPGLFFIYYTPFRNTFVSEYKSAKGEGFTDSLAANANPRSLDAAGNKAVKPRGEMKNDDEHWRSGFSAGTTSKSNDEIGIGNEDTHDRKALLLEDKDRDSDSDLFILHHDCLISHLIFFISCNLRLYFYTSSLLYYKNYKIALY